MPLHRAGRWGLCAASAIVAVAVSLACTVAPSASGRPCNVDADCGGGHYCQTEIAPQVCIPGALGLPELANFPPLIERAIVIVPIGLDVANPPLVHEGDFSARDPEGDAIRFVMAEIDREGELGRLDVDDAGHWTFRLAAPVPETETLATHTLQAIDAKGNVGVAQALVVVTTQPPSEFLMYWAGTSGTSASFSDAAQWTPNSAPSGDRSVAIGPGAAGDVTVDADVEVFGWLSNKDVAVALEDHVVTVRGTRILSDTTLSGGGKFVAAPVGNFDFEVQLGGLLPALELRSPARAIGQVKVAGDLVLGNGGRNDGVVRLEADLSVDGSIVQAADGPGILMQGGALRTGGDIVLTGDAKSVITAGLLDVGGALDAPEATFGGPDLLVRFAGGSATSGQAATVRLADTVRIGNAAIVKDAAVAFTTELIIEGTLQVAGGMRVDEPMAVDTLVLRPSFVDLGAGGGGSVTARTCFIAPFLARPGWLACDVENIVPPLDRPDGGVDVEPPPDPGPPSACTRLDADIPTNDGGRIGIANDNMEHGLVVVNAGGDAVTDRFAFDGLSLAALGANIRGGLIQIEPDGSYAFTPNTIAGVEGLDITMAVGVRNDDGTELIAGTQEACLDLHIIDTTGMNVMIGFSWDDPAGWTFGRVPTAQDRVFVPASARPRVAGPIGGDMLAREIYVSSGAVLYAPATRTLRVSDVVLAGGTLDAQVVVGPPTRVTSAVGGRIAAADPALALGDSAAALICGGGVTRLAADVDVATLRSEQPCSFTVGLNRFTARADVFLEQALGFDMNDSFGAVAFEGDLTASALGGIGSFFNRGEIQFRGLIDVGAWLTPAAPEHRAYIIGQGDVVLDEIEYNGTLTVNADTEGSLTINGGGHINRLFALRDVVLGDELFVETLIMNPQFDTSTPELFRVEACSPQPQHEACLNPPD